MNLYADRRKDNHEEMFSFLKCPLSETTIKSKGDNKNGNDKRRKRVITEEKVNRSYDYFMSSYM